MAPYSTGFGCGLGSELLLLSHAIEKVTFLCWCSQSRFGIDRIRFTTYYLSNHMSDAGSKAIISRMKNTLHS